MNISRKWSWGIKVKLIYNLIKRNFPFFLFQFFFYYTLSQSHTINTYTLFLWRRHLCSFISVKENALVRSNCDSFLYYFFLIITIEAFCSSLICGFFGFGIDIRRTLSAADLRLSVLFSINAKFLNIKSLYGIHSRFRNQIYVIA